MRNDVTNRQAIEMRLAEVHRGVARGWAFTPQHGKRCFRPGWQTEPPLQLAVVERLAMTSNIAVRTGSPSGVVIVDDDTPAQNAAVLLELSATPTVQTGSGKRHHYFRQPDFTVRNSTGLLLPGVDVKGERGAATFVGSVHPDTHGVYRWVSGLSPNDIELASLPEQILDLLRPRPEPTRASSPPAIAPCDGSRPERYAVGALRGAALRVFDTREGARNSTLNREAFTLARFVAAGLLARERVENVLAEAARATGLLEPEIVSTLRSGLDSGLRAPRPFVMPEVRS